MMRVGCAISNMLNKPLREVPVPFLFGLAVLISLLGVLLPESARFGNDWRNVRLDLLAPPFAAGSLYPPHVVLFTPHIVLPEALSILVQSVLLIVTLIVLIRRFDGTLAALFLTLGNPATLWAIQIGQLDWIAALALLLPAPLAGLALTAKPQAMFGIALLWARRRSWANFAAAVGVLTLGVCVYGAWWQLNELPTEAWAWSVSIFPFGVPAALYLAWRAWHAQRAAVMWAVLIAPLASPYFALYSLAPVLAVVCSQNRRLGAWLVLAVWYLFFYTMLREVNSGRF